MDGKMFYKQKKKQKRENTLPTPPPPPDLRVMSKAGKGYVS